MANSLDFTKVNSEALFKEFFTPNERSNLGKIIAEEIGKVNAEKGNLHGRTVNFAIRIDIPLDVALDRLKQIEHVKQATEVVRLPTQSAIDKINEYMECAISFNKTIKDLTLTSLIKEGPSISIPSRDNHNIGFIRIFQFDLEKWKSKIKDLTNPENFSKAKDFIQECKLDLIEALSEFNIASSYVKGSKYRDQTSFLNYISDKGLSPLAYSILQEARKTIKGNIYFYNTIKENGQLYLDCIFFNAENSNWFSHSYLKTRIDNKISVDLLMGKKEGDRIILPELSNFIFRLSQSSSIAYASRSMPFENLFIFFCSIDQYKESLVKAYGEEFVKQIQKQNRGY